MTVIKHEGNSKRAETAFDYDVTRDILSFAEGILNELNTTRDEDNPKFSFYYGEMEKLHVGDTSNMDAVKLDEYFGSIGLETELEHSELSSRNIITPVPPSIPVIL